MHWPNILIKPEPIAGIELSDAALRFALLKQGKKNSVLLEQALLEPLAPGDLVGNRVNNPEGLAKSLANLAAKTRKLTQLAVLTLPADYLYLKIVEFPADLEEYKIEESIELMAHFQLPLPADELYFDWQVLPKQPDSTKRRVLIVATNKNKIDELVSLFTLAGIELVAIEFHQLSAGRLLEGQADPSYILAIINQHGFTVSLTDQAIPVVAHPLPEAEKNKTGIESAIKHLADYAQTERHDIKHLILLGDSPDVYKTGLKSVVPALAPIAGTEKLLPAADWVIALGAARRGLLPRQNDKQISLMPLGTEEIYEHQKAISFVAFITRLTATLSIFFVAVFFGSWVLMNRLQTITGQQIATYSGQAGQGSVFEMQNRAQQLNQVLSQTNLLLQEQTAYSRLVNDIEKIIPENIIITSLAAATTNQPISLVGTAKTRADLNSFIKVLNGSGMFAPTPLPLDNLDKRIDIPFSFSLSLAAPALYATK
ncbi:pilus assembly protein PilM [Candidatus Falkowbacteria bacterium]|nr:pilus assembly protein PilM [Candidatus Falkowbacteria bacterium]